MDSVQVYPPSFRDFELEAAYQKGLKDGYEVGKAEADSSFYRGVNSCYWFLYKLFNGGKSKSPRLESEA
jgi:hypothetical protein